MSLGPKADLSLFLERIACAVKKNEALEKAQEKGTRRSKKIAGKKEKKAILNKELPSPKRKARRRKVDIHEGKAKFLKGEKTTIFGNREKKKEIHWPKEKRRRET